MNFPIAVHDTQLLIPSVIVVVICSALGAALWHLQDVGSWRRQKVTEKMLAAVVVIGAIAWVTSFAVFLPYRSFAVDAVDAEAQRVYGVHVDAVDMGWRGQRTLTTVTVTRNDTRELCALAPLDTNRETYGIFCAGVELKRVNG